MLVAAGVLVGCFGVFVGVAVLVGNGVFVFVGVGVIVGVFVMVGVSVIVGVFVGVSVGCLPRGEKVVRRRRPRH